MANSKLGSKEIQSLLSMYSSELNKLRFQTQLTRQTIAELKTDLKEVQAAEAAAEAAKLEEAGASSPAPAPTKRRGRPKAKATRTKGRRGRPSKAAAAPATTTSTETEATPAPAKRRGRPKSTAKAAKAKRPEGVPAKRGRKPGKTGGYRLSEYDLLVIESLEKRGKILIASEMQDYIEGKFKEEGKSVSSDEVKLKITRSLQKLANRRDDLKKVRFEGRGFAYAHPKWINPAGELKKKYQRK